jgi:hypothetical protein
MLPFLGIESRFEVDPVESNFPVCYVESRFKS